VVGISLFRTAEQALLNSAVHGNATRVQVTLASETNGVLLTITDNGFGLSAGPILRGRGSLLMDSATQAVGGNWSLRTAEGEGAILTAHFPLGGS
jgi:signal transduction histidine kinase